MCIGGKSYPPRWHYLERLLGSLMHSRPFKAQTCWGCYITLKSNKIIFLREAGNITEQISFNESLDCFWDGRFTIRVQRQSSSTLLLKSLGKAGWNAIKGAVDTQLPTLVCSTLPTFWEKKRVIAIPHLHYYGFPAILSTENCLGCIFSPEKILCSGTFTIA